jgi:predicted ABC-type ATPase
MKKPLLIVIAGPNGSGKTSITKKILQHEWIEECEYINPDDIAKDVFGDWNNKEAVLKAAILSTKMREDFINAGKSLIFETVLSADNKVEFIKKAKAEGYFIRLFFVGTDSPTINAGRIAKRVMEGGHDVPISKIISRYSKSIANCCICAAYADRVYLYDNSIDFEEPTLLFRISDGKIQKQYTPINHWALKVFNHITNEQA